MARAWLPGQPEDNGPERWLAADDEAWRGDVHASADDVWRGTEHFADWPEASAGPEYWMYKRAEPGPDELP